MSEDKHFPVPLHGTALKKWKKQQKAKNFSRKTNSSAGSTVSSSDSKNIGCSENTIVDGSSHVDEDIKPSEQALTNVSVETKLPTPSFGAALTKWKREEKTEKLTENVNSISGSSVCSILTINTHSNAVVDGSGHVLEGILLHPSVQKLEEQALSDDETFLGFSPQAVVIKQPVNTIVDISSHVEEDIKPSEQAFTNVSVETKLPTPLFGSAFKKWKKEQKAKNLRRNTNSSLGSIVSSIDSKEVGSSENTIIDVSSRVKEGMKQPSEQALTNVLVETKFPTLKRKREEEAEKLTENTNRISSSSFGLIPTIDTHGNAIIFDDSGHVLEGILQPSVQISSQQEQELSDDEPFLGFSPQVVLSTVLNIDGSDNASQQESILPDGEPFIMFSPQPVMNVDVHADVEINSEDEQVKSQDTTNVISQMVTNLSFNVSPIDALPHTPPRFDSRHCSKILVGGSSVQNACCAIAVTALLYAAYKRVDTWIPYDFDEILNMGIKYHELSALAYQESSQVMNETEWTPYQLVRQLEIHDTCYNVEISDLYFTGRMTKEYLQNGIEHLNNVGYSIGVLRINDLYYGIIVMYADSATSYAFFDSHGRTANGQRFGSRSAILMYNDVETFVESLYNQFYDTGGLEIYPVRFVHAFHTLMDTSSITDQRYFKIILGHFCQSDRKFREPHHQCSAMVVAAIAFSLEKPAHTWNGNDIDAILDYGQKHYEISLVKLHSKGYRRTLLEPSDLKCNINVGENSYQLDEIFSEIKRGSLTTGNLLKAINEFDANQCTFGILIICGYSYGLLKCAIDDCETFALFDSHGRTAEGTRPGNLSCIIFFNNASELADFLSSDFADEYAFELHHLLVTTNEVPKPQNVDENLNNTPNRNKCITQNVINDIAVKANVSRANNVPVDTSANHGAVVPANKNGNFPFVYGQTYFKIIRGHFCQSDEEEFPEPYHQCSAMVVAAVAFNLEKPAYTWDRNDIDTVLHFGQDYYDICLATLRSNGINRTFLEPSDFENHIKVGKYTYQLDEALTDIKGGSLNQDELLRAINEFDANHYNFGILITCAYSYGLLKCTVQNCETYALFDSHGRTAEGKRPGCLSCVLFFNNAHDLTDFFCREFVEKPDFQLHPLLLTCNEVIVPKGPITNPPNVNLITDQLTVGKDSDRSSILGQITYDISIPPAIIEGRLNAVNKYRQEEYRSVVEAAKVFIGDAENSAQFFHIECGARSENTEELSYHPCRGIALASLIHGEIFEIEEWTNCDFEEVFLLGKEIFDDSHKCTERFGFKKMPSTVDELFSDILWKGKYHCKVEIEPPHISFKLPINQLGNIFQRYEFFKDRLAILTIDDESYAIHTCKIYDGYALYDSHGRNVVGEKGDDFSQLIFFTTLHDMFMFLMQESRDNSSFSFEIIHIRCLSEESELENICDKIISGRLSQNDFACMATNFVFLACTNITRANSWLREDLDKIVLLGGQVHRESYESAIANRTFRKNQFLDVFEITQRIVIQRNKNFVVFCKPSREKQIYGRFAHLISIVESFFSEFESGILRSTTHSVALHKYSNKEYFLFIGTGRNNNGKLTSDGPANIFIFEDAIALATFVSRLGEIKDFVLTPLHVELEKQNISKRCRRDETSTSMINENFDSDDEIPLSKFIFASDSLDDNIPLADLQRAQDITSKDLPFHREDPLSSEESHLSVRSLPILRKNISFRGQPNSTQLANDKRKKQIRGQTKHKRDKYRFSLLPDEVQKYRTRWRNWLLKLRRMGIPNVYKNFDEFYAAQLNDEFDDEIVRAADRGVEHMERYEDLIRQRLQYRATKPTYLDAYANQEDVDEKDERFKLYQLSAMDNECVFCGALYFKEECNSKGNFTKCCMLGEIVIDLPKQQAQTYPHIFKELLTHKSPMSKEFLENILLYNNAFSFASMGATNFKHLNPAARFGPVLAVDGMIHHVAEKFQTNVTGQGLPSAQVYYLDVGAAVDERNDRLPICLNKSLLKHIEIWMRSNNPLASAYRMLRDVLREVRQRPNAPQTDVHLQIVRNRNEVAIRQNFGGDFSVPTANEVAMVYNELPAAGTKNLVIFPTDEPAENGTLIEYDDPNRDAMCYPLLFPFAEQTWTYNLFRSHPNGQKKRQRITVREFYAHLLHKRGFFSPILSAGKGTQRILIDSWSRVQENDFSYQQTKEGQKKMRAETYGALQDYLENNVIFNENLPGRIIPMPTTIVGSRKYIEEKYNDAMALASKFGKPAYMITFTLNNLWNEIRDNIPYYANPADEARHIGRVFKAKLDELVDDLVKKEVLGKCSALIYVIEWQKRTQAPHAHFLMFSPESEKPKNGRDIDAVISAEIPCPIKSPRLHKLVTSFMGHNRCGVGTTAVCMKPDKTGHVCCSKNFPKKFYKESELVNGTYPNYRRRNSGRTFKTASGDVLDNRWIVPYNPYLLLKYGCHLNVEYVSSFGSIKYLFKYFHKYFQMARLKITLVDGVQVYNEFEHYVDSRYLGPGEASWRLDCNDMMYSTHVTYRLPVHLENYQKVIFTEENMESALEHAGSMLTAYFTLNQNDPQARQYLYTEIPEHYVYVAQTRSWKTRERGGDRVVVRLYRVNYNALELYSLRLLLLTVRGAQSFADLRNIDGIQYVSFREAAMALGLLEDDEYQIKTFEEMVFNVMPHRLRTLFAQMLVHVRPTDCLALWNRFKENMSEDFIRNGKSSDMAENLALQHITYLIVAAGKSNDMFLLPMPKFDVNDQQEADNLTRRYDHNYVDVIEEQDIGNRVKQLLQSDQQIVFDTIMNSVHTPQANQLFFIDGPGGSGKTFLYSALISVLRGMGKNVCVVGWTGMSASLLKGGRTVHSTFSLPLNMDGKTRCNITPASTLGQKFREMDVLIWDEITVTDKDGFNAVDILFRHIMGRDDIPFGGKLVVTSGDWRQCLPVVEKAMRPEIVAKTVRRSMSWQYFKKYSLTTNKRLSDPTDLQHAQWLLDIGDGLIQDYPPDQYYESYVKIPQECLEEQSIVDGLYGQSFNLKDVQQFSNIAIVTPLNDDANALNEEIYKRATEDVCTERIYYSADKVIDMQPGDKDDYDISFLHTLKPSNMPPHVLKLKVNCIIMLLRNLNPTDGFCNGTRLIVKKLYTNCIVGEIFDGPHKGKQILIPKVRTTSKTCDISGTLERFQFPVQLCFVMTINKSQGQSFDGLGILLRKAPFAHGQLYVAFSRSRSRQTLRVQVFPDVRMGKLKRNSEDIFVPNIVYKEVL